MYAPAETDIQKDTTAKTLGTPIASKIGTTIEQIAITAPTPNVLVKIRVVTMHNKTVVKATRSPPSSTVFRMSVAAIPEVTNTRPKKLPNATITAAVPQLNGPLWKIC